MEIKEIVVEEQDLNAALARVNETSRITTRCPFALALTRHGVEHIGCACSGFTPAKNDLTTLSLNAVQITNKFDAGEFDELRAMLPYTVRIAMMPPDASPKDFAEARRLL